MTNAIERQTGEQDAPVFLESLPANNNAAEIFNNFAARISDGVQEIISAVDNYTRLSKDSYLIPVKSTTDIPLFIDTQAGNPSLAARAGTLYARLEIGLKNTFRIGEKPSADNTRNSAIREITAPLRKKIVEKLHEEFPDLSPDHLSILAAVGVGIGAVFAAVENKRKGSDLVKLVTAAELVVSSALDAFDGELARLLEKSSPQKIDFFKGGLKDAAGDRLQELFLWLSHYYAARQRGDRKGEVTALCSLVTNTLPSIARAYTENRGYTVLETGIRPDRFLGSRFGRVVVGIVGAVYPEIKNIPVQAIGDGLVAVSNLASFYERLRVGRNGQPEELSLEKKKEAQARLFVLTGLALVSLSSAIGAFFIMRDKNHSD
jgi:phosphatidylglycerophosphate synthase